MQNHTQWELQDSSPSLVSVALSCKPLKHGFALHITGMFYHVLDMSQFATSVATIVPVCGCCDLGL